MASRHGVEAAIRVLACAFDTEAEAMDFARYSATLKGVTDFQLNVAVQELIKTSKSLPTPLKLANRAKSVRATLGKQKVKLIDMFGNIIEAELTGNNRVKYCPICHRVQGSDVCSLCAAGLPIEGL